MSSLILISVFACFWIGLTGALTLPNAVFGFFLSAVSLFVFRKQAPAASSNYNLLAVLSLSFLFVIELVKSAINVSLLVLRPNMKLNSGIFAYETKLTKDSNITLLANLITLTPGTLTVDVSENKRVLFIHAIDCSDVEATKAGIRNGFEQKIREAFGENV